MIVNELNFSNYYWNDEGIFILYKLDTYKLKYKIIIDAIDTFPVSERKEIYPHIFIVGMGQLSTLIKKYNPNKVVISCKRISEVDFIFWKKTYEKGLAEFFYINDLKHTVNLINRPKNDIRPNTISKIQLKNEALLPNGGGKDSCVSCEILKKNNIKFTWATLGATTYRTNVIRASNVSSHINMGASEYSNVPSTYTTYRGHIPYTLYTSSFMVLLSGLTKMKYIVYSNEKSSNYPNLEHCDDTGKCMMINHQYTKSFEFEEGFHKLLKRTVHPDLEYFSLLKPLYEIQISRIFSNFPQYHHVFVSCNSGRWCGRCSKCAFIFMSMYPYLGERKMTKIIGNNMLQDKNMLSTYLELTGNKKHKPFECVGTIEENNIAMKKCIDKSRNAYVNKYFIHHIKLKEDDENKYLQNYDEHNVIPFNLKRKVKSTIFYFLNKRPIKTIEHFTKEGILSGGYYTKIMLWCILVILIVIIIMINKRVILRTMNVLKNK